jgi:hypothetical protein
MAVEDEFNIEIPDREADEIYTPRQAVEVVSREFMIGLCKQECSLRIKN